MKRILVFSYKRHLTKYETAQIKPALFASSKWPMLILQMLVSKPETHFLLLL